MYSKIEIVVGELFLQTTLFQQVVDRAALAQIDFGIFCRRLGPELFLRGGFIINFKVFFISAHESLRYKRAIGAPYNDIPEAGKKDFFNQVAAVFTIWSIVGCLVLVVAQVFDPATSAAGFTRLANIASVEDEPVMRVQQISLGHELQQCLLHLDHVLSRGDAGAVAYPENVGIHGHGQLAERSVKHYVRGLAAHAGQGFQGLSGFRHLTVVLNRTAVLA